jgi:hypothetical protein
MEVTIGIPDAFATRQKSRRLPANCKLNANFYPADFIGYVR